MYVLVKWNYKQDTPLGLPLTKTVSDNCDLCSKNKLWHVFQWGAVPRGNCPFSQWHIDYIGSLPPSTGANQYALTMIDFFMGLMLAFPIWHATKETTVTNFMKIILDSLVFCVSLILTKGLTSLPLQFRPGH